MWLRKKKGQAAACEGWNTRESVLQDFISLSPGVSPSQHNIIEWSSSDEDSEQQPNNNNTLSREQIIHLSENVTLQNSLTKTTARRNVKTTKVNNGKPNCSFIKKATHVKTSGSIGRSKPASLKLDVKTPDIDDVSISTEQFLSSNIFQSIATNNQYNKKVNNEANLIGDQLKTPKHGKEDMRRIYESDTQISPIIGSQSRKAKLKGHASKSVSKRSSDDDIDRIEPASPVLGSQRTVFNFKSFKRSSNSQLAPRKLCSVSGISRLTQNSTRTPVMEVADPNEDKSRIKKRRNLNHAFLELESKDLCKLEVQKTDKESLGSSEQLSLVQTRPSNELYDRCLTERKVSTNTDNISVNSQFVGMKGREQWNLQKKHQNNLRNDNSRLSALRDSFLRDGEEVCGDICIEHTNSQNSIPRSEEPDGLSDDDIDVISSPCKESLDNYGTLSLTQVSCDPSISAGSSASSFPMNENPSEKVKTGSDWIRALQQRTPERPSSKEETEGAVESGKKKSKKNGLAGRLHRLMLSWQSSVHIWAHQMSLLSPQSQKTHSLQKKVLLEDTKSPLCSSRLGVIGMKKMLTDNSHKSFSSSVSKNLQNFFVESPASSPEVSSLSKGNHMHMPRKYLDLVIIKVGGRLPNNAAICEGVLSNTKVFQKATKMENEKEFKSEEGKYGYKRKYCVFFALNEKMGKITLHVDDTAKVYAPWQCLNLPSHSIPILFTSYFTIKESQFVMNEKQEKEENSNLNRNLKKGNRNIERPKMKKIILTAWTCKCSSDATVLPSVCDAPQYVVHRSLVPQGNSNLTSSNLGFTVVKDTPEESSPQNEVHPAYTILEAIERCGGVSDVPVTISIRIHRIISHRETTGEIKEWELVGQDAGGKFCTVKIPNRTLVCHLTDLLEREGGMHRLTHVTISQRLTNTQDPSLFSLISSLHKAYQDVIYENPHLFPLLKDQASRPAQTYCYVFIVSLGLTKLLHTEEEVLVPVTLPHWSIHEALQVSCDGQRGSLSLYILYKVSSFLYVVSNSTENEENHSSLTAQEGIKYSEKRRIHRKEEDSKDFLKTLLVTKVTIGSKTVLPSWIPGNGTVMQSAMLKDAVIWHGSVMMDEYSLIHQQDSKMKVTLFTLHKILQPLSANTQHYDLTLISGNILQVDEETAYTWPTCGQCKSDDVLEVQHGMVDCLACEQNSVIPSTGYCLEVWLNCGLELQQADIKVKLYQRTIEKLLSACSGAKAKEYNAKSLIGQRIGPIVCVLEGARRPRRTQRQTYILTELPY